MRSNQENREREGDLDDDDHRSFFFFVIIKKMMIQGCLDWPPLAQINEIIDPLDCEEGENERRECQKEESFDVGERGK